MMKFKEVSVTPKMATKWLEQNNANRGLSDRRVDAYARDMVAGNWFQLPHGLVFNVKGDLLDGQHRLHAVIKADKAVRMVIVTGVDHEVRKFIDKGRPRSIADVLKMHGAKYAHVKAAIARWLRLLDADNLSSREYITAAETEDVLAQYKAETEWLDGAVIEPGFARAPYLAAVLWCLPLGPEVEAFHEKVQLGVGLAADEPAMAMRKWFIGTRNNAQGGGSTSEDCLMRALNCIHAAKVGEPVTRLFASAVGYRALAELKGTTNARLKARKVK